MISVTKFEGELMEPQPDGLRAAMPPREWQWGWGICFLANIPVALFFGLMATDKGGLSGMLVGVLAVWFCGHLVATHIPTARGALLLGGACTALSQFFPLLQIAAGLAALEVVPLQMSGHPTETSAFAVTILTAGQLLVVALFCGAALRGVGRLIEGRISRGQY